MQIDVSNALPSVGDRESIKGAARLALSDVYDVVFAPGDEVGWEFEIRRIAGGVEVSGSISGAVDLTCYRCLEKFDFSVSVRVREHALWLGEVEDEDSDEYAAEYMVTDGILDLEPVIRDAVCLAFPVRRVCDESCKGLCPSCGANLNVNPCGCDSTRIDARLKPLEELKKRLEDGGK